MYIFNQKKPDIKQQFKASTVQSRYKGQLLQSQTITRAKHNTTQHNTCFFFSSCQVIPDTNQIFDIV